VQQWERQRQETDQTADRARKKAASDARLAAKLKQIETITEDNNFDHIIFIPLHRYKIFVEYFAIDHVTGNISQS